jgi:hypothetical protein
MHKINTLAWETNELSEHDQVHGLEQILAHINSYKVRTKNDGVVKKIDKSVTKFYVF